MTAEFYRQFSSEKEEAKRRHALLAFVGASYFERCGRAERILADLHKTPPVIDFAFGLSKFSPAKEGLSPQVDMIECCSSLPPAPYCTFWQPESYLVLRELEALLIVDGSSNEHQILRDIFNDSSAISTIKLLQIANAKQQKMGLAEPGFLFLTPKTLAEAEKAPETTMSLYFHQLKNLNLRDIKEISCGQWDFIKEAFTQGNDFDA